MRRTIPVFAAVFLIVLVIASEAAAGIRVIAATGHSISGVPGDVTFNYFLENSPTINNRGEVAFVARSTSGSAPGESTGIWTTGGNQLAPLITDFEPAPGIPNDRAFTLWFNHVAINNSGATAFDNRIEWWHPDVQLGTEGGIWSNQDGSLRLVTRMGDPAPGAPAGSVLDALPMALRANDSGDVAFLAQFDDGLDNDRDPARHGIWMHTDDQLVPISITGGPAPGFAAGSFQKLDAPLLNNRGHLAFTGQARAEGQIERGLWSNRSGTVAPVLLEGDLLRISDNEFATSTGSIRFAFNGNDRIAFSTSVEQPGGQTQAGLWLETDAGLSLVMAQGRHAPGTPAEAVFRHGPGEFSMNDAGQIALSGSYTTGRTRFEPRLGGDVPVFESGLWLYDDGQLQLIAREGDVAPSFAKETRFKSFSPPMINDLGQVVFRAQLETVDEAGALVGLSSLWATDLNGNLKIVAKTGMQIDIDAGPDVDLREILYIDFGHVLETVGTPVRVYAGTTDGRGRSFNDRGELAFHVRFSDDTFIGAAVLVVDTLAVPEPASLAMASLLCAAMLVRQMRRRRVVRSSSGQESA